MIVPITSSTVLNTGSGSIPFTLYVQGTGPGIGILKATLSAGGNELKSDSVRLSVFDIKGLREVDFTGNHNLVSDPDPARPDVVDPNTGQILSIPIVTTSYTSSSEWYDSDLSGTAGNAVGDRRFPIVYTKNQSLTLNSVIDMLGPADVKIDVKVTASYGSLELLADDKHVAAGGLTLTGVTSTNNLPDNVDWEELVLTWKISFNDGVTWEQVGISENPLYLTYADPTATPLFHSLVHIGSSKAKGAQQEQSVVDAIWSYFAGLDVHRVDRAEPEGSLSEGALLTYWKPPYQGCVATNTAELLKKANGQCGSWAEFFRDTLGAQGISAAKKTVYPINYANIFMIGVSPWTFTGAGTVNINNFAHPNDPTKAVVIDVNGNPFAIPIADLAGFNYVVGNDLTFTAPQGQGNSTTPEAFFNHFITEYNGVYYDPSYGIGPYVSKEAWETAALDAFLVRTWDFTNNMVVILGRREDPAVLETNIN
jgi:hypothetical protein